MSILDDLLGLSAAPSGVQWTPLSSMAPNAQQVPPSTVAAPAPSASPTNTLGFPVAQPGTGMQFNLPTTQQQMGQPAAPTSPYHGLSGFLDRIGDALLIAHGAAPIHMQRFQQQQANTALQGFLQNPDQAIAALMRIPGQERTAVDLYKAVHPSTENPEVVKDLIAAGIDPKSDQGKQIILDNIGGKNTDTSYVKDLQAAGIDPKSPEGIRLLYAHNSPAGYLLTPPGASGAAPAQSLPLVNTTDDYAKLPPGTRYRNSAGQVGVKGGATAPQGGQTPSASGGFR